MESPEEILTPSLQASFGIVGSSLRIQAFGAAGVANAADNLAALFGTHSLSQYFALSLSGSSGPAVVEPPDAKFARLASEWRRNTRYVSSLRRIVFDPAYYQIMLMNKDALPFIFAELKTKHAEHWFWALRVITDEIIGKPDDDIETVRILWLKWGRDHDYIHS
jgi:hypothetical protein